MRRFRSLYRAYRELRYRFEEGEEVGGSGQEGGKAVLHEDDICKGDEPAPPGEAHLRKEVLEAEEKIIRLERQLKRQEILAENAARERDAPGTRRWRSRAWHPQRWRPPLFSRGPTLRATRPQRCRRWPPPPRRITRTTSPTDRSSSGG